MKQYVCLAFLEDAKHTLGFVMVMMVVHDGNNKQDEGIRRGDDGWWRRRIRGKRMR